MCMCNTLYMSFTAATDGAVTFPGRKKIDELYHLPCDRSEFYSMSDLLKPPILFTPSDEIDKVINIAVKLHSCELNHLS